MTPPLTGRRVRVEPVSPARAEELFAAGHAGDPDLWRYLPYGPFGEAEEMRVWLAERAGLGGSRVRRDRRRGVRARRRDGLLPALRPEHRVVEIGHIWFGGALQRTPHATEAIFLLARHAFETLGVRRLEWKCDAANARSRRAAERFGFTFEGVFRQHMLVKGRNRDTAWYALLDGGWPAARAAFEAWLDDANFDGEGRQRRSLAELREPGAREP